VSALSRWTRSYRRELRRCFKGDPPTLGGQESRARERLFFASLAHLPVLERESRFRSRVHPYSQQRRPTSFIACERTVPRSSICRPRR
jgi:hypothetical protein